MFYKYFAKNNQILHHLYNYNKRISHTPTAQLKQQKPTSFGRLAGGGLALDNARHHIGRDESHRSLKQ